MIGISLKRKQEKNNSTSGNTEELVKNQIDELLNLDSTKKTL